MSITLSPNISSVPFNSNAAFNNSWITVVNNQNRPLFAQAVYPVTVTDQLNTIITLLSGILAK